MKHLEKHYFGATEMSDVTEIIHNHYIKTTFKFECTHNVDPLMLGEKEPVAKPLADFLGFDDRDASIYVVTNSSSYLGAELLFDHEFMDELLEVKFKADEVIVLPSSIHEVLVLSANNANLEDLTTLVRTVNETQVAEDERLWNSALVYERGGRIYEKI